MNTTSKLLLAAGLVAWTGAYAQTEVMEDISPEPEAQVREQSVIAGGETDELHGFADVAFASMYVTSGAQGAYASLQPNIELEYYGFYAGIWANLPFDSQPNNPNGPFNDEYDIYAGYGIGLLEDDLLTASLGGTYYWYPESGSTPNRTWEINFGLIADVFLTPGIEVNYDFNLKQLELIIVSSYDYDLSPYTVDGLGVSVGAAFGYLQAEDADSDQVPGTPQDSYFYVELALDLTWAYNDNFLVYAGPRFSTNDNGASNLAGRATNVWWGVGANLSF
jgi:hypothetical protein